MEDFDNPYYTLCKFFMRSIGLWPYQRNHTRIISFIGFMTINLSLLVPQAISLVQLRGTNFRITVENMIALMFGFACLAKYTVLYLNKKGLKILLLQVNIDWKKITDEKELKILSHFSQEGRGFGIFFTVYLFTVLALYCSLPFIPYMLDRLYPLENGTRPVLMPYYGSFIFFDQMDYYYHCCIHITIVYFTSCCLFAGINGAYVLTVKHTCAMFAITCNIIENMLNSEKTSDSLNEFKDDSVIRREVKRAVTLHNETLSCSDLLEDSFSKCFLFVESTSVVGIALCAVYVLYISDDLFRAVRLVAFLIGIIIHIFYMNWVGQQIIDSSFAVFNTTCSCKWYLLSVSNRKFINIILSRSMIPCEMTAGKIAALSMESFGILMKTSMSYFTVFFSVSF